MSITASLAHAATPLRTLSASQTIGHCGFVPMQNKLYTSNPRNIAIIQRKLHRLGYDVGPGRIDGMYGKDTKRAVRQFQKDLGLTIDGRVGHETGMILAYASHPIANVQRCKGNFSASTR